MNQWNVSDAWKSAAFLVVCVFAAARSDAGLLYEPSNYAAQNNLLLHLDGIRNVGLTKAHDSTAAAWIDLSSSANSAVFGNTTGSGITSAWAADGYTVGGGEYGKLQNTINVGNVFTIQIVCDMTPSAQGSKYPSLFGAADDKCNFYTYNTGTSINFKTVKGARKEAGGWTGRYVTGLYNKAGQVVFHSASGTVAEGASADSVGAQTYYIGGVFKSGNDTYLKERYLNGTIKAIRIYSKVLTTAELTANRAIDDARFFNGIPVTNAVVATAVAGVEGNESVGVYAVDENGYTFSAPRKTMTADGKVYACVGYTLETWDTSAGAWSGAIRKNTLSCAVTDAEKVRITWLWTEAGGTAGVDLDTMFDGYVTNGLVFHADGIRNVGATLPHDYSSTSWVDLVAGKVASFLHDEPDGSYWTADGYYFGGSSCAQFLTQLTGLTNVVTVQVVSDVTPSGQRHGVSWPTLFGCNNNDTCNLYNPSGVTFKNAGGGNVWMAGGTWKGRYVTAIRDATTNYIFQTTNIVDAAKKDTAQGNIGSATIRFGSAGNTVSYRKDRYLVGTIKAVRIYDRVLTDDEIAQNRVIDDIRFFGAALPQTNVVVASSMRGVEGVEPAGNYVLPETGHTFTAPANAMLGEDEYTCIGYTLETWDTSSDTWSAPVLYSGVLAAAITDTNALVRLTWQWSHTAGPGHDIAFSDYATDGLILHLDGIRNTGVQPFHDMLATRWQDLSQNDYATFTHASADGSDWSADGYYFGGSSYAIMETVRTLGTAFTIQIVSDVDPIVNCRSTTIWPALLGTINGGGDPLPIYMNNNNSNSYAVNCKVNNVNIGIYIYYWTGKYATVWSDGTVASVFDTVTPSTTKEFSNAAGTRTITIGGGNGGSPGYAARYLIGTIKSVRIYNRALTDAELAANRATDEARFFGRGSAATGDLIVASTVEGLAGVLPAGAYRPADGYVFTAPETAFLDGTPYELTGYTLETWDATEATWGEPVTYNSYSYTADVSSASRRLTWQWRVKSRLTRIRDDYDVGDYAQNGLYLNFDGIRNAGAATNHDDAAETWVNLGTAGTNYNAVFDYSINASAGEDWMTNGFNFVHGGKFARLLENPNLGNSFTIQTISEFESGTSANPTLFGSTNDFCNIYTVKAGKYAYFKFFNKTRTNVLPSDGVWEGKYVTAIWHKGKNVAFQYAVPDRTTWSGTWGGNATEFKNEPFYIGGIYKDANDMGYANARRMNGVIHAIRVYKRVLTDEELTHNREVDEARFFGNFPTSNVVIAQGQYDTSTEAVGNYLVEGAYTFTANMATTEGGSRRSVVGYTIETWDENEGAWGAPVFGIGDSYTYTDGISPAKVRLTWKWMGGGTMLMIR